MKGSLEASTPGTEVTIFRSVTMAFPNSLEERNFRNLTAASLFLDLAFMAKFMSA